MVVWGGPPSMALSRRWLRGAAFQTLFLFDYARLVVYSAA